MSTVKEFRYSFGDTLRANGFECVVTDCNLDTPLSLGSIITVKHNGVSPFGVLKNPTYWRLKEHSLQQRQVNVMFCNLLPIPGT